MLSFGVRFAKLLVAFDVALRASLDSVLVARPAKGNAREEEKGRQEEREREKEEAKEAWDWTGGAWVSRLALLSWSRPVGLPQIEVLVAADAGPPLSAPFEGPIG